VGGNHFNCNIVAAVQVTAKITVFPKAVEVLEDRNNPFVNTIFENKELENRG
jgi:hypothetical protein